MQRWRRGRARGIPQSNRRRKARQANFGSAGDGPGRGVGRRVRGASNVRAMEMYVGRRPVKGGPARQGLTKMAAQRKLAGGPGVLRTPGRRPPHRNGGTFGSFSHERTTIIRYVGKKMAAEPTRQVSCTTTPAKANKEKSSVRSAGGCGVSGGVNDAGKPVRPILAARTAGRGTGAPAEHGAPPGPPGRFGSAGGGAGRGLREPPQEKPPHPTIWVPFCPGVKVRANSVQRRVAASGSKAGARAAQPAAKASKPPSSAALPQTTR